MSQSDQWTLSAVAFANQGLAQTNYHGQYAQSNNQYTPDVVQQLRQAQLQQLLAAQQQEPKHMEGNKPIVVCGTVIENCDDLDKAQRRAEELAHKLGCNAYILKPVRMVAPKRDVVTTEL